MKKALQIGENVSIPMIGFGTWKLKGRECVDSVSHALSVGYRHIDTADIYGNHREVADAIKQCGIPRQELFVTTKVWNVAHKHDDVIASGERFLHELELDYVDLLLVHWPNREVPIEETFAAMEELRTKGVTRSIGVSNFTEHHLEDAFQAGVSIVNNQIEVHPHFKQAKLREFCQSRGISVTAYSPLGQGTVIADPLMKELAEKYAVSPAQVALNWAMSHDMIAIPKSADPGRIEDNLHALDWDMSADDIARIDAVPDGARTNSPAFGEFDY